MSPAGTIERADSAEEREDREKRKRKVWPSRQS